MANGGNNAVDFNNIFKSNTADNVAERESGSGFRFYGRENRLLVGGVLLHKHISAFFADLTGVVENVVDEL